MSTTTTKRIHPQTKWRNSTRNPWQHCPQPYDCWRKFRDGHCDRECDRVECLFDGYDCDPDREERQCNELYDAYCLSNYQNGFCDQGCNNKGCGFDGLDCVDKGDKEELRGVLVLRLDLPLSELQNNQRRMTVFLRELSSMFDSSVGFEPAELTRDEATGMALVKLSAMCSVTNQALGPDVHPLPGPDKTNGACFSTADQLASFLAAFKEKSRDGLNLPSSSLAITSLYAEAPDGPTSGTTEPQPPTSAWAWVITAVVAVGCVALIYGVLVRAPGGGKMMRAKGITWFPEGFFNSSSHHGPASSAGRRHAQGAAARAAGGDHYGRQRIGFPDGQEMRSFKKSIASDDEGVYDEVAESRAWSQQHLDAFAPSPPAAMSPAQTGYADILGPGGFTPLMVAASYEPQNSEHCVCQPPTTVTENMQLYGHAVGSPTTMTAGGDSGDFLAKLIEAGASLSQQSDAFGETALHLAARYARADAAKRLLDAGADANIQDNAGRTPLHTAVSSDAMGVFELLLRNRATDLNAQMHDGSTALILAARGSQTDMLDQLLIAEADVNAQDEHGKTALHWAAAVNCVAAIRSLLKHGANRDAQDHKDETPLFLACREGCAQAARHLLENYANRDITDCMDRLPRDVAMERMHHDLVKLLDDFVPALSPGAVAQSHAAAAQQLAHVANHHRQQSLITQSQTLDRTRPQHQKQESVSGGTLGRKRARTASTQQQVPGPNPALLSPPASTTSVSSPIAATAPITTTPYMHQRQHSAQPTQAMSPPRPAMPLPPLPPPPSYDSVVHQEQDHQQQVYATAQHHQQAHAQFQQANMLSPGHQLLLSPSSSTASSHCLLSPPPAPQAASQGLLLDHAAYLTPSPDSPHSLVYSPPSTQYSLPHHDQTATMLSLDTWQSSAPATAAPQVPPGQQQPQQQQRPTPSQQAVFI